MGNQNSSGDGRLVKDLRIRYADNAAGVCVLKVDGGMSPPEAKNDLLVEVRICLKTGSHGPETGAARRAASSFA